MNRKPIFRWTVGDVSDDGLSILNASIKIALSIYKNNFDWYVCFNGIQLDKINSLVSKYPTIKLYKQDWSQSPLKIDEPEQKSKEEKNSLLISGSVWKICPPRLNINVHEIVVDNDIILHRHLEEIDQFLTSKNKTLIAAGCKYFCGEYAISSPLNSGFYGLPPNYDFSCKLYDNWIRNPKGFLNYADEQGLVCQTLEKENHIIIPCSKLCLLPPNKLWFKNTNFNSKKEVKYGSKYSLNLFKKSYGLHFVYANRMKHNGWKFYVKQKFFL